MVSTHLQREATKINPAIEVPGTRSLPLEPEPATETGTHAKPKSIPRQSPPQGTRWWVQLIVLAALGVAGYLGWPYVAPYVMPYLTHSTVTAKSGGPRTVPVLTAKTHRGSIDLYLNGLGSVVGFNTVTVRSRVEGELVKVLFAEGQMVQKGDLLAEIDTRPFEVQLKQAEGQLIKDEAALHIAQLDLDRYNALKASRSVTQQQIDAQVALVRQSEGAIEADQAQIDNAQLQLTYCHITAPVTGRVGLRIVDPGNIVRANEPTGLVMITQLQPIAVVFTIPQDEISRVQQQIKAGKELVVEAYDREFRTKLATGKLLALDNQVDVTTGTVKIKAIFQNDDNMLFPNQFVNARLLVDTEHDVVLAPASAVQRGPESMFVYVVKPDSTVELRRVEIGATEAGETVIAQGLQPGESVVTDGVDKLQPGSKVAPREAAK
ncbi:MAG TPA: MdtA/MuxA family multidrug efflux RND transporter periplasmic adaptor subunit [Pirellulales bacterium]|nr:MdtA/MuxA family multidrug efflux RND transporter periplasmic adaptor subunit [Pirellulales bacterium]